MSKRDLHYLNSLTKKQQLCEGVSQVKHYYANRQPAPDTPETKRQRIERAVTAVIASRTLVPKSPPRSPTSVMEVSDSGSFGDALGQTEVQLADPQSSTPKEDYKARTQCIIYMYEHVHHSQPERLWNDREEGCVNKIMVCLAIPKGSRHLVLNVLKKIKKGIDPLKNNRGRQPAIVDLTPEANLIYRCLADLDLSLYQTTLILNQCRRAQGVPELSYTAVANFATRSPIIKTNVRGTEKTGKTDANSAWAIARVEQCVQWLAQIEANTVPVEKVVYVDEKHCQQILVSPSRFQRRIAVNFAGEVTDPKYGGKFCPSSPNKKLKFPKEARCCFAVCIRVIENPWWGDSPEFSPLDSYLFADLSRGMKYLVALSALLPPDHEDRYSLATPESAFKAMSRAWKLYPTDTRIIQDIKRLPSTFQKVLDANGTIVKGCGLRSGVRATKHKGNGDLTRPLSNRQRIDSQAQWPVDPVLQPHLDALIASFLPQDFVEKQVLLDQVVVEVTKDINEEVDLLEQLEDLFGDAPIHEDCVASEEEVAFQLEVDNE